RYAAEAQYGVRTPEDCREPSSGSGFGSGLAPQVGFRLGGTVTPNDEQNDAGNGGKCDQLLHFGRLLGRRFAPRPRPPRKLRDPQDVKHIWDRGPSWT